ncbi:MAG TPA: hypothetical protein PKL48_11470, partial [Thermodesulfobacteriota bacterium]|nr:hypothetical protein [Thermodesulfobacteriota bacterium]
GFRAESSQRYGTGCCLQVRSLNVARGPYTMGPGYQGILNDPDCLPWTHDIAAMAGAACQAVRDRYGFVAVRDHLDLIKGTLNCALAAPVTEVQVEYRPVGGA